MDFDVKKILLFLGGLAFSLALLYSLSDYENVPAAVQNTTPKDSLAVDSISIDTTK